MQNRRKINETSKRKKEINFLHFSHLLFCGPLKIRLTREVFKKGIKRMKGPVRQESASELRSKTRTIFVHKK